MYKPSFVVAHSLSFASFKTSPSMDLAQIENALSVDDVDTQMK